MFNLFVQPFNTSNGFHAIFEHWSNTIDERLLLLAPAPIRSRSTDPTTFRRLA